jgi:hypothetical protein
MQRVVHFMMKAPRNWGAFLFKYILNKNHLRRIFFKEEVNNADLRQYLRRAV